jgi:hypothetical protein
MRVRIIVAAIVAVSATACAGVLGGHAVPFTNGVPAYSLELARGGGDTSVLKTLTKQVVIGSTVDPLNGDLNPYGLAVATVNNGFIKKGDLYVCNFNDKANVQGTGTTIVSLAPVPGSKPVRFEKSSSLLGCAALTINEQMGLSTLYAAAFGSKSEIAIASGRNPATGKRFKTIAPPVTKGLSGPFGVALATDSTSSLYATTAILVSDATTGSIVLAQYCQSSSACTNPGVPIVTGFAVNHGKPGNILGPSGLVFDLNNCVKIDHRPACGTLYVVDGVNDTVVAIHNVLQLHKAKSIVVGKGGTTFSGPEAKWAQKIYAGKPLDGPISAALLYNGNLVVGNTLNPKGTNLLVELSPTGRLLDTKNVDKGPAGALFGIVATGKSAATQKVYFNDDNANNLQVLEK